MKKFLLSVAFVAIAGLAMLPADAKAFGGRKSCKDSCAQPCEMTWEDRKVTCYKTVTKEKEIEVTVCKPEYRDEVRKYTTTVCVPVWTEQKKTCTTYKRVAKEVEREVTKCVRVPVTTCDPCTGRTRTCSQRQMVTEKVKCTVYECVPETKEVTVKVCSYKKEEKTTECKVRVCEMKQVKEMRKVQYCERVAYETTIKVCVAKPVEAKKVEAAKPAECKPACAKTACCEKKCGRGLNLGSRLSSRKACSQSNTILN